jgi:hypothetical protein
MLVLPERDKEDVAMATNADMCINEARDSARVAVEFHEAHKHGWQQVSAR